MKSTMTILGIVIAALCGTVALAATPTDNDHEAAPPAEPAPNAPATTSSGSPRERIVVELAKAVMGVQG